MTQFKRDVKNGHLLRWSYLRKKQEKIKLGKTENGDYIFRQCLDRQLSAPFPFYSFHCLFITGSVSLFLSHFLNPVESQFSLASKEHLQEHANKGILLKAGLFPYFFIGRKNMSMTILTSLKSTIFLQSVFHLKY